MSDVKTLAYNKTLRFLQPNDSYMNNGEIAVRIERNSDGYVYDAKHTDPKSRIFKPDLSCANPFIPLNMGSGNNSGRLEASLVVDSNFIDGEYVISYHDMRNPTKNIFALDIIEVWDGCTEAIKPLTDLAICIRLMNIRVSAHKTAGTIGAWMNNLETKINDIQTKVNAINAKT